MYAHILPSLPLRGVTPPHLSPQTYPNTPATSPHIQTQLGAVRLTALLPFDRQLPNITRREWPRRGLPMPRPALPPRHPDLLIRPNNASLPAPPVITKAATLQRVTQTPIRSTLCHYAPQSWRPRLPQPIHATLVMMKRPQGKSLAHSALLWLQAKPARVHSTPVFLSSSLSWTIIFQTSVSCGVTRCAYGNISA